MKKFISIVLFITIFLSLTFIFPTASSAVNFELPAGYEGFSATFEQTAIPGLVSVLFKVHGDHTRTTPIRGNVFIANLSLDYSKLKFSDAYGTLYDNVANPGIVAGATNGRVNPAAQDTVNTNTQYGWMVIDEVEWVNQPGVDGLRIVTYTQTGIWTRPYIQNNAANLFGSYTTADNVVLKPDHDGVELFRVYIKSLSGDSSEVNSDNISLFPGHLDDAPNGIAMINKTISYAEQLIYLNSIDESLTYSIGGELLYQGGNIGQDGVIYVYSGEKTTAQSTRNADGTLNLSGLTLQQTLYPENVTTHTDPATGTALYGGNFNIADLEANQAYTVVLHKKNHMPIVIYNISYAPAYNGEAVDIGSYTLKAGDLDILQNGEYIPGNSAVDSADKAALTGQLYQYNTTVDLNDDGFIDAFDLSLMYENIGMSNTGVNIGEGAFNFNNIH
jgi:hypothetical protein